MSSDRTLAEVWADQVATAQASGLKPPDRADPETEAILRELLGEDPAYEEAIQIVEEALAVTP